MPKIKEMSHRWK